MAGQLIVVEGSSGVGKSTIAGQLRQALGAALFHYPAEFTRFRSEVAMDSEVGPLANLVYHLGATLHLSDLVRAELAARPVVCDRYLPGPLSLLSARGVLGESELERLSGPFEHRLVRPALTVLVRATWERVCERIRARSEPARLRAAERWVLESRDFFRRRETSLARHAARLGPVTEFDTTEMSAEESGQAVAAICRAGAGLDG